MTQLKNYRLYRLVLDNLKDSEIDSIKESLLDEFEDKILGLEYDSISIADIIADLIFSHVDGWSAIPTHKINDWLDVRENDDRC